MLLLTLICLSCDQAEMPKSIESQEIIASDSLSFKKDAELSNQEYHTFPQADSLVYSFLSSLNELEKFIDPHRGVYCIEPGPGASPIMEKLVDKEDLLGKSPFLFFYRDISFVKNKVLMDPVNFDPCNEEYKGYVLYNKFTSKAILEEIYKITAHQEGAQVNDSLMSIFKDVDGKLSKDLIVKFEDKHGESIMLRLYFSIKNNRLFLSLLDLRDCGA